MLERSIVVQFIIREVESVYVVECQDLPIITEADTLDEAQINAVDALVSFVDALQENGALEAVLTQYGVSIHEGAPPTGWTFKNIHAEIGALLKAHRHSLPAYA